MRLVATCCYSTLLVDHPYYAGNTIMAMSQAVRIEIDQTIEKLCRIQMKDFPKERVDELKPFNGNLVDKDNLDDFGKYASITEAGEGISAILAEDVGARKGKKFKDFEAKYGLEILGLEHYKEKARCTL